MNLLDEIRRCTLCTDALSHPPRPVVQLDPAASLLVIAQASGRRVHASGVPFDDPSGVRLREWLGIDAARFYDPRSVAILPMGFCYPGTGTSGDLRPRPECAPAWHARALSLLRNVQLTLLIGQYAQRYYLPGGDNVTGNVGNWRTYLPHRLPLPHPSGRNNIWLARNPWFGDELLPALRARVAALFAP